MSTASSVVVASIDLSGLQRLASSIHSHLPTPQTIALVGTLGAGKTALVQSLAKAAGVDQADVTSPTFTLLQTHRGSPVLHHLDAYRVADEEEFLELGVEELFEEPDAWTLVEWADRVQSVMPTDALWIEIEIEDTDHRTITFTTTNEETQIALKQIEREFA